MSTREAAAVISLDGESVLYWHLPRGRTAVSLPDDPGLWAVFWTNRHIMSGHAHTHPGTGWPGPSHEDLTTYLACESALGQRYRWWIASMDRLVVIAWNTTSSNYLWTPVDNEPRWVAELRKLSHDKEESNATDDGDHQAT